MTTDIQRVTFAAYVTSIQNAILEADCDKLNLDKAKLKKAAYLIREASMIKGDEIVQDFVTELSKNKDIMWEFKELVIEKYMWADVEVEDMSDDYNDYFEYFEDLDLTEEDIAKAFNYVLTSEINLDKSIFYHFSNIQVENASTEVTLEYRRTLDAIKKIHQENNISRKNIGKLYSHLRDLKETLLKAQNMYENYSNIIDGFYPLYQYKVYCIENFINEFNKINIDAFSCEIDLAMSSIIEYVVNTDLIMGENFTINLEFLYYNEPKKPAPFFDFTKILTMFR